jgi:hypothetical protein
VVLLCELTLSLRDVERQCLDQFHAITERISQLEGSHVIDIYDQETLTAFSR